MLFDEDDEGNRRNNPGRNDVDRSTRFDICYVHYVVWKGRLMMNTITKETRNESYNKRPLRRDEILWLLKTKGEMTAREVANELGYVERNAAAPRLTELVKAGRVHVVGKKSDNVTGRKTAVYSVFPI